MPKYQLNINFYSRDVEFDTDDFQEHLEGVDVNDVDAVIEAIMNDPELLQLESDAEIMEITPLKNPK